ncbi:hypothetical protein MNV49_007475 [Pseudohyphozyma bogoriensis]|nr:hypothetical protein MNV49_007475 [Pseudohyphozyma bogoriensis]
MIPGLGAPTWKAPPLGSYDKKFLEKKIAEAAKKKEEEDKKEHEEAVKAVEEKLLLEEIVETGRSGAVENAEARLKELAIEIAALEAKKAGKTAEQIAELESRMKAAEEAEARAKVAEEEAKNTAEAMVKANEKELEERRKKHDEELERLADHRRRELLDWQAAMGIKNPSKISKNGSPLRQPGYDAGKIYSRDPQKIYEDPRFWKLSEEDQHYLESLSLEEQHAEGFGPYEADEHEAAEILRSAKLKARQAPKIPLKPAGLGQWHPSGLFDDDDLGEPQYDPQKLAGRFLVVTTDTPQGYEVLRNLGTGVGAFSAPILRLSAQRQKKRELQEKRHALSDLIAQAVHAGGNTILGLKFERRQVTTQDIETLAHGIVVFAQAMQRPSPSHHKAAFDRQPGKPWQPYGGLGGGGDWGDYAARVAEEKMREQREALEAKARAEQVRMKAKQAGGGGGEAGKGVAQGGQGGGKKGGKGKKEGGDGEAATDAANPNPQPAAQGKKQQQQQGGAGGGGGAPTNGATLHDGLFSMSTPRPAEPKMFNGEEYYQGDPHAGVGWGEDPFRGGGGAGAYGRGHEQMYGGGGGGHGGYYEAGEGWGGYGAAAGRPRWGAASRNELEELDAMAREVGGAGGAYGGYGAQGGYAMQHPSNNAYFAPK